MERPRGPRIYKHGLVEAYRTSAIDGEPAELWTLSVLYRDDASLRDAFADGVRFLERHPAWQSLPSLVEAGEGEMVVVAPPWVSLDAIARGAAERGGLAAGFVMSLVRDLARDLASADPRVALRSLSPSTIAVNTWGRPRLLDLTLVRFEGRRSAPTEAGVIKGEVPYMSPETALGRLVDRRSDVFSLGLIAYELLANERAIRAETEIERLMRVRDAKFSFAALRELHAPVADLVEHMLSRSRAQRIEAGQLVAAIEERGGYSWSPAQMFDEVRRVAPAEVEEAITFGL